MEFQLARRPRAGGRPLRLRGLQTASVGSLAYARSGPAGASHLALLDASVPLDNRHGLIRSGHALLTIAAALAERQPDAGISRRARQPQRQALQLRQPRHASPGGAAAAPASASAAAGAAMRSRPLRQLLAGGVAGAVSKTLVAPLERVSTMLMADGARAGYSTRAALATAWRQGGLAGLFRGNAATLAKIFPASAVQFMVFHSLKDALLAARAARLGGGPGSAAGGGGPKALAPAPAAAAAAASAGAASAARAKGSASSHTEEEVELTNAERMLAGAAAGAASVSLTYPLESVRTLMSVGGGMDGGLLRVWRGAVAAGGVGALYRGFAATLWGDVMGNAVGFTFYEIGNRAWRDAHGGAPAPPSVRGVIGALSAAAAMTLTMPLEVVRRRLQLQGTLGRPVLYRGTLDALAKIARAEGPAGFYRAALPAYAKVAPGIGAMYFMYELMLMHMDSAAGASAQQ